MSEARYLRFQELLRSRVWYRRIVTLLGIYSIVAFALYGVWILALSPVGMQVVLLGMVAFGVTRGIVCNILFWFFKKPRPYQQYSFTPFVSGWFTWLNPTPDSFPSKHTASLASISMVLLLFVPVAGVIAFIITALTGLARVVLGYHYYSDIFLGLIIGTISGYVTALIWFVLLPPLFT